MAELKHYLRKIEFSKVVAESLLQLSKQVVICDQKTNLLIMEIIEEFVFFEVDRRGPRKTKLTCLQELQILHQICQYFDGPISDLKMVMFAHIFPSSYPLLIEKRKNILTQLVSMSSQLGNGALLTCVGILIHNLSPSHELSLYIAKHFYQENYTPPLPENITDLSILSPMFCASFINCLCFMYSTSLPGNEVIGVIQNWIKVNPSICYEAHTMPTCASYPQSILPGLLNWSIVLPFFCPNVDRNVCLKLHLTILQSMAQIKKLNPGILDLVPFQNLYSLIDNIKAITGDNNKIEALQIFGQAFYIGLNSGCIIPHKETVKGIFEAIRIHFGKNRFMDIIESKFFSLNV